MCLLKDEEEMKKKEKEMDRYLAYLSMVHSHPIGEKEYKRAEARDKFERSIKPKEISKLQEPSKETDVELLRKIKEGG